ncbi:hypothetical protein AB5N19_14348 [Seiridium cardinale]
MSDVTTFPLAARATIHSFVDRAEFWLGAPGHKRAHFWEVDDPQRPYATTAPEVVEFTQANCLAVTAGSNSELLNEFTSKLNADWEKSKTAPQEAMQLARSLSEYLVWIDHLFFFGIITRPTRSQGDLRAARPLIALRFIEGVRDGSGNELEGAFVETTGDLTINMLKQNRTNGIDNYADKFQPFEKALCVVVHELVHVYLYILTRDSSASNYHRHIHQGEGHGVQFYELLQFILTKLFQWAPSMAYLGDLAAETRESLHVALESPFLSDAAAIALMRTKPMHELK